MAIGRVGDVINGEHISKSSDLPWAVQYLHPGSLSYGLPPQHPATGYELVAGLLIAVVLLFMFFRVRGNGWTFFSWLVLYGVVRFFISFLRLDKNIIGDLNAAQLIALGGIALGVIGLLALAVHSRRGGPSRAERRRLARQQPAEAPPP
jgi:phosphatidylglycerol:prolipoprotein diacylglycerol transferase